MNYTEKDILNIAKRENNNKRKFLLVNPLQGKHLPVSPAKTIKLIRELANKVFSSYDTEIENVLVIGFAETATALGAILADYAPYKVNYIHTTRETIESSSYLFFSEEHSHATEQKLEKNFLDRVLVQNSLIIFAEDEVTTGKTVENVIAVLEKTYPELNLRFGIASILNGMPAKKLEELLNKNIQCHFLLSVPHYNYDDILSRYSYGHNTDSTFSCDLTPSYSQLYLNNYLDTRKGVDIQNYIQCCDYFSEQIYTFFSLAKISNKKILVLGTEEFMYPGLHFGHFLEMNTKNNAVFFHATTRSPILPCSHMDYPIKSRYSLSSFYSEERITYLYNLSAYDYVFVTTDSTEDTSGFLSLHHFLRQNDCRNIIKITWRSS
ncbi:MAG: phosphoribosyl transferase [Clostridiales bacterium]|uniref:phosphoribosyltransferase domain-containing protein n=1 Tax=Aminipila sp. TaxID=2060095 RepID=UPI001D4D63F4|nr:phosphoribosyltransferase domain-containing protein [Aminipila sp.]MBE6035771.1 phosphoribosyl transferase [Clostridiales bacterium]